MTQTLYKQDFYAWTKQQAALLQAEALEKLDLPNLVEEIESMGNSQRRELDSRLTVLLMHLLKLTYQAGYATDSWRNTIREQRRELKKFFRSNHTLHSKLPEFILIAYQDAREAAADETHLPLVTFPADCPWESEQILGSDWLPG